MTDLSKLSGWELYKLVTGPERAAAEAELDRRNVCVSRRPSRKPSRKYRNLEYDYERARERAFDKV